MKIRIFTVIISFILFAPYAKAQNYSELFYSLYNLGSVYQDCVSAAKPATQLQKHECSQLHLKRSDDALNEQWQRIISFLDSEEGKVILKDKVESAKKSLIEEQRAWITFKDSACQMLLLPYLDNELNTVNYYNCKAQICRGRVVDLVLYYRALTANTSLLQGDTEKNEVKSQYKSSDEDLNKLYKQYHNQVDKAVKKARIAAPHDQSLTTLTTPRTYLTNEQRLWVRFKEKACSPFLQESFLQENLDSSYTQCLTQLTNARKDQLAWYRELAFDTP